MLKNELNLKNFELDNNESNRVRHATQFANDKLSGDLIVAEIGVQDGINAKSILRHSRIKHLYLVDSYGDFINDKGRLVTTGYGDYSVHYARMFNNVEEYKDKVTLISKASEFAASLFEDNFFDWIYIDAGHETAEALSDMNIWFSKVRLGGVVSGHDIGDPRVRLAVDTFVADYNKDKSEDKKLELIIKVTPDADDWMFIKK